MKELHFTTVAGHCNIRGWLTSFKRKFYVGLAYSCLFHHLNIDKLKTKLSLVEQNNVLFYDIMEQLHDAVTNSTLMFQFIGTLGLPICSSLDDLLCCFDIPFLFVAIPSYYWLLGHKLLSNTALFTSHNLCVYIYIYIYMNKRTIIKYNGTQTCGKPPTCFFSAISEWYLTK